MTTFKNLLNVLFILGLILTGPSCTSDNQTSPSETTTTQEPRNRAERIIQEEDLEVLHVIDDEHGQPAYYVVKKASPSGVSSKYALDREGNAVTIQQAYEYRTRVHLIKHGKLTLAAVETLEKKDDDYVFNVHLSASRPEFLTTTLDLELMLREDGIEYEKHEFGLSFYATKRAILERYRWAKDIWLLSVYDPAPPQGSGEQSYDNTEYTAAGYNQALLAYNLNGGYAKGVKVGIVERFVDRCSVYSEHESLSQSTITYESESNQNGIKTCDVSENQPNGDNPGCSKGLPCARTVFPVLCVSPDSNGIGRCVSQHPSMVMSRIASTRKQTLANAAQVDFYVANDSPVFPITPSSYLYRYMWLHSKGVSLVNESYTTYDDPTTSPLKADEKAQWADRFARYRNMLFVQSSGNAWAPGEQNDDVFCQQLNGICVGATHASLYNPTIDYLAGYDYFPANFAYHSLLTDSRSGNPRFSDGTPTDIERPDLVSEGGDALVMKVRNDNITDDWTYDSGTSYAAPTVTAMIALEKEVYDRCQLPFDRPISVAKWRAMYRNNAYAHQTLNTPTSDFYPIPGHSPDSKAGVGIPLLLSEYVNNEDCTYLPYTRPPLEIQTLPDDPIPTSNMTSGETPIPYGHLINKEYISNGNPDEDLISGWEPAPSYFDENAEQSTEELKFIHQPLSSKSPYSGNLEVKELGTIFAQRSQEKYQTEIRASLAFYSCNHFEDILSAYVDYDLALCSPEDNKCIAISQSVHDVNEGFHLAIPEQYQGKSLKFYLIKQKSQTQPCPFPPGTSGIVMNPDQTEPWEFVAMQYQRAVNR